MSSLQLVQPLYLQSQLQRRRPLLRVAIVLSLFLPPLVFATLVATTATNPTILLMLFSFLSLAQLVTAIAAELWINGGYLLSAKVLFWTSLVFFHAAGAAVRVTQVRVAADSLLTAAVWCLVGIACACAGGLLVPSVPTISRPRSAPLPRTIALGATAFLFIGTLSFFFFVSWLGWAKYLLTRYSLAWLGTAESESMYPHFWRLAQLLWYLGMWLVVIGLCEFRSLYFRLLIPWVILVVLVMALGGTRGAVFCGLLVAMLVRHKRKPYSNLFIAMAALLSIASFGPLAIWRVHRLEATPRLQPNFLLQRSLEAGCQLRVVAVVTDLFPSVYPYSWGRSYLAQLVGKGIPIIGWRLVADLPYQDLEPARWLTWVKMAEFYPGITIYHVGRGVAGWGYSIIAEAYQNFGPLGVFIVLPVFGALAALLDRWFLSSSIAGELVACLFISNFLFLPRASFSEVFDGIVVGAIAVAAFSFFSQLNLKKRFLPSASPAHAYANYAGGEPWHRGLA